MRQFRLIFISDCHSIFEILRAWNRICFNLKVRLRVTFLIGYFHRWEGWIRWVAWNFPKFLCLRHFEDGPVMNGWDFVCFRIRVWEFWFLQKVVFPWEWNFWQFLRCIFWDLRLTFVRIYFLIKFLKYVFSFIFQQRLWDGTITSSYLLFHSETVTCWVYVLQQELDTIFSRWWGLIEVDKLIDRPVW